jgi:hypothetical protein
MAAASRLQKKTSANTLYVLAFSSGKDDGELADQGNGVVAEIQELTNQAEVMLNLVQAFMATEGLDATSSFLIAAAKRCEEVGLVLPPIVVFKALERLLHDFVEECDWTAAGNLFLEVGATKDLTFVSSKPSLAMVKDVRSKTKYFTDLMESFLSTVFQRQTDEPLMHDVGEVLTMLKPFDLIKECGILAKGLGDLLKFLELGNSSDEATLKILLTDVEDFTMFGPIFDKEPRGPALKFDAQRRLEQFSVDRRGALVLAEIRTTSEQAFAPLQLRARSSCVMLSIQERVLLLANPREKLEKVTTMVGPEFHMTHAGELSKLSHSLATTTQALLEGMKQQFTASVLPVLVLVHQCLRGLTSSADDAACIAAMVAPPLRAVMDESMHSIVKVLLAVQLEQYELWWGTAKKFHSSLKAMLNALFGKSEFDPFDDEWAKSVLAIVRLDSAPLFKPEEPITAMWHEAWEGIRVHTAQQLLHFIEATVMKKTHAVVEGLQQGHGSVTVEILLPGDLTCEVCESLFAKCEVLMPVLVAADRQSASQAIKAVGGVDVAAQLPKISIYLIMLRGLASTSTIDFHDYEAQIKLRSRTRHIAEDLQQTLAPAFPALAKWFGDEATAYYASTLDIYTKASSHVLAVTAEARSIVSSLDSIDDIVLEPKKLLAQASSPQAKKLKQQMQKAAELDQILSTIEARALKQLHGTDKGELLGQQAKTHREAYDSSLSSSFAQVAVFMVGQALHSPMLGKTNRSDALKRAVAAATSFGCELPARLSKEVNDFLA